jgi:hypothetical protein
MAFVERGLTAAHGHVVRVTTKVDLATVEESSRQETVVSMRLKSRLIQGYADLAYRL